MRNTRFPVRSLALPTIFKSPLPQSQPGFVPGTIKNGTSNTFALATRTQLASWLSALPAQGKVVLLLFLYLPLHFQGFRFPNKFAYRRCHALGARGLPWCFPNDILFFDAELYPKRNFQCVTLKVKTDKLTNVRRTRQMNNDMK
jgi:hypothetical protein